MKLRFTLLNETLGTVRIEEPVGWDDIKVSLVRNTRWHSVSFEYTLTKLKFYRNSGRDYIISAYTTQGVDGKVEMLVERYDTQQFLWVYEYKARLKLKELDILKKNRKFWCECGMEQSDFAVEFKNKEDIKVKLSGNEHNFTAHSKIIRKTDRVGYVQGSNVYEFIIASSYDALVPLLLLGTSPIELEITTNLNFPLETYDSSKAQPIFNLERGKNYSINGRLQGLISILPSFLTPEDAYANIVVFKALDPEGALGTINFISIQSFGIPAGQSSVSLPFDFSFSDAFTCLREGEKIWIAVDFKYNFTLLQPARFTQILYENTSVSITELSTFPETQHKGYLLNEAFSQVVIANTGSPIFQSQYFGGNGKGAKSVITNGLQLRQFPINQKPVFVSFKDLFEGLNAIHNLGVGFEQIDNVLKIVVEPKYYFYPEDVSIHLEAVADVKINVADSYYFNEIEVGYKKFENEEVNGLDEFNSKRQYSLQINSFKNKVDALSTLIASGYAIEFTRRQDKVTTTDWKYDNDLFIICLNQNDLSKCEKNEAFDSVSGVFSPETSYNLRITPARNLQRWRNFLAGGYARAFKNSIIFSYGEGNYNASTKFVGSINASSEDAAIIAYPDSLSESQDITIANPAFEQLFVPETYEFEYPLTLAQLSQIRNAPNKCISFNQGSDTPTRKGSILDVSITPKTGKAKFKLLRKDKY